MSLKRTEDRWRTFHAREPRQIREVTLEIPDRWELAGQAAWVCYRSDKWTGDFVDYKHDHERPYPKSYVPKSRGDHTLPAKFKKFSGLAILGDCIEWAALNEAGGEMVERFARQNSPVLATIASGKALFLLNHTCTRVLAVCYGGKPREHECTYG